MSKGANLGYVRVSTVEQNEARQVEALEKRGIDKWFIEKVSGKNMTGPSCARCWITRARATRC